MDIMITRKTARAVTDAMPTDTEETQGFFAALLNLIDEEQGMQPGDREGISITIVGTEL